MSDQYPPQYPPQYPSSEQPPQYVPQYPGVAPQAPYPNTPGAYPPPPPGYPQQQPGFAPAGYAPPAVNSKLAITSLVLGIVGLCTGLAGIAAVICGHMALNEIKKSNNALQGRGMAIAGLVLGYLEIVGIVLWIGLVVIGLATSSGTPTY